VAIIARNTGTQCQPARPVALQPAAIDTGLRALCELAERIPASAATICPNAATARAETFCTLLTVARGQEVVSCVPMI